MSFLRVTALRSTPTIFTRTATRAVRRTASQPCMRLGHQTGRRGYASATDAVKKTSDLPWAASAVIVTAVGTYIALSPSPGGGHGDHDKHHDDHGDAHAEKEDAPEEKFEDDGSEEKESKDEGKDESKDKSSGEEEPKEDKEESKSDDEPKEEIDTTNAQENAGTNDTTQKGAMKDKTIIKKHLPDAEGGKVRLESPNQQSIGDGVSSGDGDEQARKQRSVSNSDTKHSTDPNADKTKSSKGEGTVESAKIKGTVQPDRPQK